jgi:ABC-2 type transport system permease protein
MKAIMIALKDMWRAFRSFFALAFMFGVPILLTLIFSFIFGGSDINEADGFTLPKTDVVFVNQDEGNTYLPAFETEYGMVDSFGELLFKILDDNTFKDLMDLTSADVEEARAAVDHQEAGLAIILPAGFTDALIGTASESVSIEFYKDPALNLGPDIIQSIVMSLVDDFSAVTISIDAITTALEQNGVTLTQQEQMALTHALTQSGEESGQEQNTNLTILSPSDNEPQKNSMLGSILRGIMGGMMIFYAFFTGTTAAQTILQEEENGTLARLFMTPTPSRTILNGKFLAGFLMIIVQVLVLIIFSNLIFKINWGSLPLLMAASFGLVALAASFGIFIMSLVKTTKQAGIIYGGALTFSGMLGISSVFTGGTPIEKAFRFLPLFVPQGWAMRAYEAVWQGSTTEALLFSGGMLIWAAVLFTIGNLRFKKRFT